MEFSIPEGIDAARERVERILGDIYYPHENYLLTNQNDCITLCENIERDLRTKAVENAVMGIEVGEHGGSGNCFLARAVIEGVVGATILPSMDFGGDCDLLAFEMCESFSRRVEFLKLVVLGSQSYDSSFLGMKIQNDNCFRITGGQDGKDLKLNGHVSVLTTHRSADVYFINVLHKHDNTNYPVVICLSREELSSDLTQKRLGLGLYENSLNFIDKKIGVGNIVCQGRELDEFSSRRGCLWRLGLAARCCGAGLRAFDIGLGLFKRDTSLNRNQAYQGMFADSVTEMHASQLMTLTQAECIDRRRFDTRMCLVTKIYSYESSTRSIEKMLWFLGRRDFVNYSPVEALSRLVRFYACQDNSNEVDRGDLARMLMIGE